jgi:NAD(P)-dependent dehydrogenase (short-subunit alcohol dehydrogenase family)
MFLYHYAAGRMRSVLITGASSGIGRATALRMDAAGWLVFAGVRSERDAQALEAEASSRLCPLKLDITSAEQIAAAVERVSSRVGEDGLDGLVNNAGITIPCPLEVMPPDDFQRLIAVNLTGQFATTQALLPQLRAAKGRIVFVSSISGRKAMPMLAGYSASKAGLNTLADGFRQELRRWKVGVSIIEPGAVETPIWDRGESELESAVGRSSVDAEHLYGQLIERARGLADRALDKRISPQHVVAAIEHALTANRPRSRYLVGLDARGQALAIRLVPDRVLDFAVGRYLRA